MLRSALIYNRLKSDLPSRKRSEEDLPEFFCLSFPDGPDRHWLPFQLPSVAVIFSHSYLQSQSSPITVALSPEALGDTYLSLLL
jgi:hypothetical protein